MAKEASDYAKPVGITVIEKRDALEFLEKLPIEKFRGVGKKTVPKMHDLNINNGQDLLQWSQMDLIKHFGKFGYVLYERARGVDNRPVEYQRVRKSIGKERTFGPAIDNQTQVDDALQKIAAMVVKAMDDKRSTVRRWSSKFDTPTFPRLPSGQPLIITSKIMPRNILGWQMIC